MQRSSVTPAGAGSTAPPVQPAGTPFTLRADRCRVGGFTRRAILAGALVTGLALGPWWHANLAGAAGEPVAAGSAAAAPNDQPATAAVAPAPAGDAAAPAGTVSPEPSPHGKTAGGAEKVPDADAEISISPHGIVISGTGGTPSDGKRIDVQRGRVKVEGFGNDRQYDSFEQFMHEAPGTAFFVFMIVTVVFLVPLLVIALLVWYKIRKTRMHNETMLKLAERGVVSPAAAMEALAGGASPAATMDSLARAAATPGAGSGSAPLYEQVRMIRRRTAWSDLRKGVILIAIGLGLSAYSMFDDGTPNGAGLICLFLGIGYCVLWFFQDRPQAGQDRPQAGPSQSPPAPPGGA